MTKQLLSQLEQAEARDWRYYPSELHYMPRLLREAREAIVNGVVSTEDRQWAREWAFWLRGLAWTVEQGQVTQDTFGPDAPKHLRRIASVLEAQGIEAQSAETAGLGRPKDESPVAEGDAPKLCIEDRLMEELREKIAEIIEELCGGADSQPNAAADRILAIPELQKALKLAEQTNADAK